MSGAIPVLTQYAFMVWCLVKAQEQLYRYIKHGKMKDYELNSYRLLPELIIV
jgi:hypothetical protein